MTKRRTAKTAADGPARGRRPTAAQAALRGHCDHGASHPDKTRTLPTGGPARPGGPTGLLGYLRVSTPGQAEHGISLAEQRHRIEQYAAAHGAVLVGFEADRGVSGRTVRRGGLQRALRRLAGGDAAGLVVTKLDRLSRSTRDVLDLVDRCQREGWELHSIGEHLDTSTAAGRFVVAVLASLAQMEREQVAERTKAALSELRRQGRRVSGRPPLGYRFEAGMVVAVAEEQAILRRLQELQAQGLGAKASATRMNGDGLLNPRTGRPWRPGTLRAIL